MFLADLPAIGVIAIAAILFAAGAAKGVIGVGLPAVAVPLLCLIVPLPTAMAALAIPLLITNLSQAFAGDRIVVVLRHLWPILAGTAAGIAVGVQLLTELSPDTLKPIVGAALIAVAALMLLAPKLHCPERHARIAGPLVGLGGGILGGIAGQSTPIVVLYLLSRGLTGARFVQYACMYAGLTWIVLTLALSHAGALGSAEAAVSAVCVVPVLLGMWVGARVRAGVPAGLFRRLVLGMVILGGFSMIEPALATLFRSPGTLAPPGEQTIAELAGR
jgi:uncharacterized membrane protein YfcA